MTQIASVLTVAAVFRGLLTLIATFYSQRRREAYTRDKNTYVGTFTKMQGGGLCVRGAYLQDAAVVKQTKRAGVADRGLI